MRDPVLRHPALPGDLHYVGRVVHAGGDLYVAGPVSGRAPGVEPVHQAVRRRQEVSERVMMVTWEEDKKHYPNHQVVACNVEAQSECAHVACTFFARLAPILCAQPVLVDKVSASELRRKVHQECVVGWVPPASATHLFVMRVPEQNLSPLSLTPRDTWWGRRVDPDLTKKPSS